MLGKHEEFRNHEIERTCAINLYVEFSRIVFACSFQNVESGLIAVLCQKGCKHGITDRGTHLLLILIRRVQCLNKMFEALWPVPGLEDAEEGDDVLTCGITNHY